MLVDDVITTARRQLGDVDGNRWGDSAMLGYVREAVYTIAAVYPEALGELVTIDLEPGSRQNLPAGGIYLGAVSNGDGTAVNDMDADALDDVLPAWRKARTSKRVRDVAYSRELPEVLWVYPPQPDPTDAQLLIRRVSLPDAFSVADALALQDHYRPVVVDFVVAWAFAENTDSASLQGSNAYYQRAMQLLTSLSQGNARVPPQPRETRRDA